MARSLGLAAYRALSRRRSRPAPASSHPRPAGDVLWLHATTASRFQALCELGHRVRSLRDDLLVLITWEQDATDPPSTMPKPQVPDIQVEMLTSDHPAEVKRFLDHWRPDICLWAGADLMPNLIGQAADRGMPMILIDVAQDGFPSRRHKWFPDLLRSSLERFEIIMANSAAASSALRRFGVPDDKVQVSEPLRNGPSPLPFPEDDLSRTSQHLTGRPLWLAAHAQADEFDIILTAHRAALRLFHRMLLVLSVADKHALDQLADILQRTNLRFVRWNIGDDIDDNTQVLISDGIDDLELWYRMAPITFMASSLSVGSTGRSPLEAVALGSALLFGPHVRDHRDTYARLTTVGAGRSVGDAEGLGAAVTRLVAPDHSAAMALAGWQMITEGAKLTDQLVELVQDRLDMRGPGDARP